jgi:AcrR family transcriptional regulator
VPKMRISKEPELRRNEIITAAQELFLTQGFEETAVSDIVKRVGVAQGLFYYYFKSKDEILDAVVEQMSVEYFDEWNRIEGDDLLNAIEKLQTIFKSMFQILAQHQKLVLYIHTESNELMHYRLGQKFINRMITLFAAIIEQGNREKLFEVDYPQETAEILVTGMGYMPSIFRLSDEPQLFTKKLQAGLGVFEKALGAAKGSLQIGQFLELGE